MVSIANPHLTLTTDLGNGKKHDAMKLELTKNGLTDDLDISKPLWKVFKPKFMHSKYFCKDCNDKNIKNIGKFRVENDKFYYKITLCADCIRTNKRITEAVNRD